MLAGKPSDDSIEDLFDRCHRRVFAIALRFSSDEIAAEDICVWVFSQVRSSLDTIGDDDAVEWLYGEARKLGIEFRLRALSKGCSKR